MPIFVGNSTVNTFITNSNTNVMDNPLYMAHNLSRNPIRPTMIVDFERGRSLDPRIEFTRATTATRVNSFGRIETVANGFPRFDYNPSTLQCEGLLVEEARTNLVNNSIDFGAWGNSAVILTANSITAPDGSNTGTLFVANTAVAVHQINYTFTAAANSFYTFSVFAKAGAENIIGIRGGGASEEYSVVNPQFGLFNLTTGTATTGQHGANSNIEAFPNGWYRCSVILPESLSTSGSMNMQIISRQYATYAGDGTSGFYIWGAQLEEGKFETSYIPTSGATVTRNDETALMTTSFANWFNGEEGTIFVESSTNKPQDSGTTGVVFVIGDGVDNTSSYRVWYFQTNINTQINDGSALLSKNVAYTRKQVMKLALGYKLNDSAASVNGDLPTTDTAVTLPFTLPTIISFGSGSGGGLPLNGYIKRVYYYPKRLTNEQLQILTS